MKILLLGKNGQIGWELQRSLAPLGEVIALDRHSAPLCGNLEDLHGLARTVQMVRPMIIVNAAAYTAVDQAESESELAHVINAQAPYVLAHEASKIGAWLVHYSTDYVFDGRGNRPWLEIDKLAPLNVYGRTKLEGECLIEAACPRHLIFRTSWVYGTRGGNFAKTMLRLAQERERLTVVNDQWGAPTGAELIADVTAHIVHKVLRRPQDAGLYHLAASGETSWHGYASHVIQHAKSLQPTLQIKAGEIVPVVSSAFPTPAKRPHNSRLDTTLLQNTFGLMLPPWQQGVDRMLAELL